MRSTSSVELAVENVVVCAAGAAHGDRADEEQQEMPEVRAAMGGEAGERGRLPARREQELPSDRPVEARELNERKGEIGSEPQDQARRPGVRQDGRGPRRGGQSGPAGSGWACGPPPPPWAACSFIFFICAATVQALALKLRVLGVMLLELGDRLIGERAPVLVLFHVGDQRRLGADETRRFDAEGLRVHRLAVKRLGEVVDHLKLGVAILGELLHVAAAIRVGRTAQRRGSRKQRRRQPVKPMPFHRR